MRSAIIIFLTILSLMHVSAQPKTLTYLALGDSYTIGESVPVYENFPYQLVQKMRENNRPVHAPEIVARTGWTTKELLAGLARTRLLNRYDLVTLLIGVNNQYRGRPVDEYAKEFEWLLKIAIERAGGHPSNVVVVSIPDWGATPFAKDRDRTKITHEINAFNAVNRQISARYKTQYADITEGSRDARSLAELVAADGLHPSGLEYAKWVRAIWDTLNW
jgi:lysophospholipase L1-like esterase